jgi:hypothetical protein
MCKLRLKLRRAKSLARLKPRCAFHFRPLDSVRDFANRRPAEGLVLAGIIGSSIWPAFIANRDASDEPTAIEQLWRGSRQQIAARAAMCPNLAC